MSADFTEALRNYYSTQFPYQLIYNWLDYKDGQNINFKFREFSFTLPGDIYMRYLSFEDSIELKHALVHKLPIKIDAGAVYNINPRLHRAYPNDFRPLQRELIFDIDISDYNDVRTCCSESQICQKCWPLMSIGAKILNSILTREFGFKHLLFVFSGRRGFHCWVCDKEARELTPEARRAIADYLALIRGGANLVKRVELDASKPLHPMVVKALEVIDEHFEDVMVVKQDFLSTDHLVHSFLDLTGEEYSDLKPRLRDNCRLHKDSSVDCWNAIKRTCSEAKNRRGKSNYFLEEVKLQHCFPRLDTHVTRGMNHLLKMPFCVHPKTGNVCVPLDIETMEKFRLDKVPNIDNLTRESLDPHVKIFKKFCDNLNDSAAATNKGSLEF